MKITTKTVLFCLFLVALCLSQTKDSRPRELASVTFANLGTPNNGTILYCSDCTQASPCAGSGSGATARRENGVWNCAAGGNVSAGGTLTSNAPVIGAGSTSVAVGTRSGNTTEFGTTTGTKTTGKQLEFDASGNIKASTTDIGAGTGGGNVVVLCYDPGGTTVTGDGTQKILAECTIDGGTFQAGDIIRHYSTAQRMAGSGEPIFRATIGNGGSPAGAYANNGPHLLYVEWYVVDSTTIDTKSYWGLRPGFWVGDPASVDFVNEPSNFNVANPTVFKLDTTGIHMATGTDYKLTGFMIMRIRL